MQRVIYQDIFQIQTDFRFWKFIGLQADLGGTEILGPLRKLYLESGIDGYLKQIFILTDGEVRIYFSFENVLLHKTNTLCDRYPIQRQYLE